jgi:hypothetical protein
VRTPLRVFRHRQLRARAFLLVLRSLACLRRPWLIGEAVLTSTHRFCFYYFFFGRHLFLSHLFQFFFSTFYF